MKKKAFPSILVFTLVLVLSLSLAGHALAQQKPQPYEGEAQRPPATYTKPLLKQTLPRPQPPKVTYFKINEDYPVVRVRTVSLCIKAERASQYRASQDSDFNGAQWRVLNIPEGNQGNPPFYGACDTVEQFDLIGDDGYKIVYFQVKDQIGQVSDVVSDTIYLDTSSSGP